jgi:hypothetical protein
LPVRYINIAEFGVRGRSHRPLKDLNDLLYAGLEQDFPGRRSATNASILASNLRSLT